MRRRMLAAVTAALVAVMVAVPGMASPASPVSSTSTAQPPPGYVPPAGYLTTPPESCYFYTFVSGAALVGG